MEPGITWYDVLGVLPGAEPERSGENTTQGEPATAGNDLGAPSNVFRRSPGAQSILDKAWEVLGDPVNRRRYDEAAASGAGRPPARAGPQPGGLRAGAVGHENRRGSGRRRAGGVVTPAGWLGPSAAGRSGSPCPTCAGCSTTCAWRWRRGGTSRQTVRLTPHPMPVDGPGGRSVAATAGEAPAARGADRPGVAPAGPRGLGPGPGPLARADGTCGRCPGGAKSVDWCPDRSHCRRRPRSARGQLACRPDPAGDPGRRRGAAAGVRSGLRHGHHSPGGGGWSGGGPDQAGRGKPGPGGRNGSGCAHISLSWEAIAADGKLFTALEADLMLFPAGDQSTTLTLAGGYRPQPGPAGAGCWTRRSCAAALRWQSAASWPRWRVHRPPRGHGGACRGAVTDGPDRFARTG